MVAKSRGGNGSQVILMDLNHELLNLAWYAVGFG